MKKLIKIFIVSIIIIYAWSLYVYFNSPIKTEMVTYGTQEDIESAKGYIIRNEKIIYTGAQGSVTPIVQEGERVPKNKKIATVYTGDVNENTVQMIKELDRRIASIRSSQSNNNLFEGDLRKLDRQMDEKINQLINMQDSKLINLSQLKSEINNIIDKQLLISGENGTVGVNLQSLLDERSAYEKKLSASRVDLYSPASGILSYEIDGLEEVLVPENIAELKPGDFDFLEEYNSGEVKVNVTNKGFPTAKIIDNFKWYIAVQAPEESVDTLAVGDNITICLYDYDDLKVKANVNYISEVEGGKVIIVFSLNQYIEDFYLLRRTNIGIVNSSHSGLKIPVSAIRVQNGKTGVFVIRNRIAKFYEIEILSKTIVMLL